jgi:hypothetical protein
LKEREKRIIRRFCGRVLKIGPEFFEERGGNRGKRREQLKIDHFAWFHGVKRDGRIEKSTVSWVATSLFNGSLARMLLEHDAAVSFNLTL